MVFAYENNQNIFNTADVGIGLCGLYFNITEFGNKNKKQLPTRLLPPRPLSSVLQIELNQLLGSNAKKYLFLKNYMTFY